MRAPIGIRISSRRRALGTSQAALARQVAISPSYLNLIERNKRDVGGSLLIRIAEALRIDIEDLTGESEQKLVQDLEEAFSDPVLERAGLAPGDARDLVAQHPAAAQAITRLHRAYTTAAASADAYFNRLRSDPLFSQLLHQILSGITAMRSGAEILEEVPDLDDAERRRFLGSITREARSLSAVAQTLIGQFDSSTAARRSISPRRELDDLIIAEGNYFPALEEAGTGLRAEIEAAGPFGEATLVHLLETRFGVRIVRSTTHEVDGAAFAGQYHFDAAGRVLWFRSSTTAATRQFQLARVYARLSAPDMLAQAIDTRLLSSPEARQLAHRALGSYFAGAIVFPYEGFLDAAESARYDIDTLRQNYGASYEQVAQRLVSLRRPGAEGVPFGFLRSDPAGRLTKHFPLPGLLLPNSGHACPLWAIYTAFRIPDTSVRQVVRFTDGSRYLFIARAVANRAPSFADPPTYTSVMLACDVLHADRTVYGAGLDLADASADVPVGPSCRLCTRRDCPSRQEEAFAPGSLQPGSEALTGPAADTV
ncbi:helix-turn-helix domain-containing protein [Devosia sp.]|uniref:helix-turn-helix domain-containing protein n=1 Tax=Devosia sp. TaxID=1871048 RepID=UPI002F099FC6